MVKQLVVALVLPKEGRYRSKLHHIGMGESAKDTRVILLVAGLDMRVLSEEG